MKKQIKSAAGSRASRANVRERLTSAKAAARGCPVLSSCTDNTVNCPKLRKCTVNAGSCPKLKKTVEM